MSSYPPVPAVSRELRTAAPLSEAPVSGSWLSHLVAAEESDLPGRIAIGASCLAVAFSLGDLVLPEGFLGLFPYQITRLLLYGSTLLAGCIMAGGFLSHSRTARYAAIVATIATTGYYLVPRLGLPGEFQDALRTGYGVALLGGVAVWALRALRRRLASNGR